VRAAHWLSHIEYDPKSLVRSPWLRELSQQNTYIRYDQRGWGPSDLSAPNMSFESWISDLEAVVDAQRLERFALLGMSQGGAIAIAFATRHPERVSQLVFFGAYGLGMLRRKGSPSSGMKRGRHEQVQYVQPMPESVRHSPSCCSARRSHRRKPPVQR
jgi:pimeloyl-ACP methyl ester carboxylesterase